ncbi:MAG: PaaI family thioesterase [Pyrinomonadaceae bacterium]|nr:PaaI family thioesterase [Pyrinomonadaceae bacterium]
MTRITQLNDSTLTEVERQRIEKAFADVPFARLLNIEMGEMERGKARLHLGVRDELRQNNGLMHGGVIASLIDTAAAFAILTVLEPNKTTTTVDLTIHYLRPLIKGRATAEARVVRAGRRIIVVAIDVLDEAEHVAATALTTYIRLT